MKRRLILAALAVAALASPAAAHEYTLGSLEIAHPFAIETSPTAKAGAGYLSITNTGDTPDRLIAVRTGFPRTQMHGVEVDANGVARMYEIDALDIPAGATVTLAPSGLHVMFMGLDRSPRRRGEHPRHACLRGRRRDCRRVQGRAARRRRGHARLHAGHGPLNSKRRRAVARPAPRIHWTRQPWVIHSSIILSASSLDLP